jgi:hypothetical protein
VLVDPDVGRRARAEHARKGFAEHGKIKYLISPELSYPHFNKHPHSQGNPFLAQRYGPDPQTLPHLPYLVSAVGMTLGFNHFW